MKKKPQKTTQMAGEEFRRLRKLIGVSQERLAEMLECSTRAIQDWESDRRPVFGPAAVALRLLRERNSWILEKSVAEAVYSRMPEMLAYNERLASRNDKVLGRSVK